MLGKLTTNIQWQSFRWDFSRDGGAVGTIDTNLIIPKNTYCLISSFLIESQAQTGGIAGGFEIGNITSSVAYGSSPLQILFPVAPAFIVNTFFTSSNNEKVLFRIVGDAFTSGIGLFFMGYVVTR